MTDILRAIFQNISLIGRIDQISIFIILLPNKIKFINQIEYILYNSLKYFRSWKGFNDILDVYRYWMVDWSQFNWRKYFRKFNFYFRLGRLHLNAGGLCPIRARDSIHFWQIDELLLGKVQIVFFERFENIISDPCCALKYYPSIEECQKVYFVMKTFLY